MPFSGIFVSLVGNPDVVMPHYQARIIKFPVHRDAIAGPKSRKSRSSLCVRKKGCCAI